MVMNHEETTIRHFWGYVFAERQIYYGSMV